MPSGVVYLLGGGTGRKLIGTNTTYYVATTGNDSTGTGTSGNPWLTLQHAFNYISSSLDVGGFTITIQLADGTYTTSGNNLDVSASWVGGGNILVQGNVANMDSVVLNATGGDAVINSGGNLDGIVNINFVKLTGSGGVVGIYNNGRGGLGVGNVNFGSFTGGGQHARCNTTNGTIDFTASYTISGGADTHVYANRGANIFLETGITVTLTGTPSFSQFAQAAAYGIINIPTTVTFSGSATGKRFTGISGGLFSGGTAVTAYPCDAVGTLASGAQYL